MITFQTSRIESDLIVEIVGRWAKHMDTYGMVVDRGPVTMDITAAHANGCPLDLIGLLEAAEGDFTHDVAGILRHLDRETGRLTACFTPRHAAAKGNHPFGTGAAVAEAERWLHEWRAGMRT